MSFQLASVGAPHLAWTTPLVSLMQSTSVAKPLLLFVDCELDTMANAHENI